MHTSFAEKQKTVLFVSFRGDQNTISAHALSEMIKICIYCFI